MNVGNIARMGLKAGGLSDSDINNDSKVLKNLKKLDMEFKDFQKLKLKLNQGGKK